MTFQPKYLRCPYEDCPGHNYDSCQGKQSAKWRGLFKIKCMEGNVMVLQCQKCHKTFRLLMCGVLLLWDDMCVSERRAFQEHSWNMKQELRYEKKNVSWIKRIGGKKHD